MLTIATLYFFVFVVGCLQEGCLECNSQIKCIRYLFFSTFNE